MGKRVEDLPLNPEPLRRKRPEDLRDQEWFRFKSEIDELLASGRYEWAADSLQGIAETVERYQVVTPGQRRAIENIRAAGEKTRGGSRRYEGWRGRGR